MCHRVALVEGDEPASTGAGPELSPGFFPFNICFFVFIYLNSSPGTPERSGSSGAEGRPGSSKEEQLESFPITPGFLSLARSFSPFCYVSLSLLLSVFLCLSLFLSLSCPLFLSLSLSRSVSSTPLLLLS